MAKKGKRQKFNLTCVECKRRNYVVSKNVVNTTDKLVLEKYCTWCRKHTQHNETKLPNPKPRT
ncbi:50S ribosomal protein L33 [Candidatus Berkelbacteria bacterium]|nr:50S ribosomal protein L33 [Candidatus Berkelbacteria bacterium]